MVNRCVLAGLCASQGWLIGGTPILILALAGAACDQTSSVVGAVPKGNPPVVSEYPLSPASNPLDLGYIPQAGAKTARIALQNLAAEPQTVAKTETGCPCLTVTIDRETIAPGETADAFVVIDLSDEPQFIGRLMSPIAAYDRKDRLLLHFAVRVTVGAPEGVSP